MLETIEKMTFDTLWKNGHIVLYLSYTYHNRKMSPTPCVLVSFFFLRHHRHRHHLLCHFSSVILTLDFSKSCIKQNEKRESVKIRNKIIYHFHHSTSIEKVKPFGMSKRVRTFTKQKKWNKSQNRDSVSQPVLL